MNYSCQACRVFTDLACAGWRESDQINQLGADSGRHNEHTCAHTYQTAEAPSSSQFTSRTDPVSQLVYTLAAPFSLLILSPSAARCEPRHCVFTSCKLTTLLTALIVAPLLTASATFLFVCSFHYIQTADIADGRRSVHIQRFSNYHR